MRAIAVDLLLVLAVLAEAICVLGIVASASTFERLHYSGATTSLAPVLVLAAVAIRQPHPYTAPVWNALVDAVALYALNNTLSHAIARVARRRRL
ncbi:MAG: hypothetical protein HOQ28_07435 [Thermoleophilia bacterium]|nr:hypothetical protein [Thermoleophilia bacterium]